MVAHSKSVCSQKPSGWQNQDRAPSEASHWAAGQSADEAHGGAHSANSRPAWRQPQPEHCSSLRHSTQTPNGSLVPAPSSRQYLPPAAQSVSCGSQVPASHIQSVAMPLSVQPPPGQSAEVSHCGPQSGSSVSSPLHTVPTGQS